MRLSKNWQIIQGIPLWGQKSHKVCKIFVKFIIPAEFQ